MLRAVDCSGGQGVLGGHKRDYLAPTSTAVVLIKRVDLHKYQDQYWLMPQSLQNIAGDGAVNILFGVSDGRMSATSSLRERFNDLE